jgi:hypothetical protein
VLELTLTSNAARVVNTLGQLSRRMDAAEKVAIGKAGLLVLRRLRQKFVGFSAGNRGMAARGLLQRRSGALARSSQATTPEKRGPEWITRVGYRKGEVSPYARMMERGGKITAKGGLLAIPVGEALTPAGAPRYRSPLDVPGGFWVRAKSGAIVFLKRTGQRVELLFVGKRSVTVPAPLLLERSARESRSEIARIVDREIAAAVRA